MEEIEFRNWDNPIIRESYNWMLKVGRELRENVVLVGGWSTYLQAQKLRSKAIPSLDIDFIALAENFSTIERYLKTNNFASVSFRYIKYQILSRNAGGKVRGDKFGGIKKYLLLRFERAVFG